jgi:dTMP kinase
VSPRGIGRFRRRDDDESTPREVPADESSQVEPETAASAAPGGEPVAGAPGPAGEPEAPDQPPAGPGSRRASRRLAEPAPEPVPPSAPTTPPAADPASRQTLPPDAAAANAGGPTGTVVVAPGAHAGPEPEQDHDVGDLLKVTAFRRLWLVLGLSSFGDWLGLLATAALATQLGGDSYAKANLAVAGVFILRLLPSVLLGPLAGAVADRMNRRFTLVSGDLVRGALFVSIPIVGTLEWLYIATVLIECAALFWMPAKDATVPNLVPRQRLEAANQISLATTYGTAPIAAVAFAGIALLNGILDNFLQRFETNPVDLALYVNAATFFVAAAVIARLPIPKRTDAQRQATEQVSVWRSIVDGWLFVGTTPVVRGLVLGMLGAFAAAGFVIGLAPTYVVDLGAGQPGFGVLFGAVFVGLAAGMWVGPRILRGFSRRRLFGLSLILAGGFLGAIALIPNIVMAALLATALGACGGVAWVTGYTLLGLEVDDVVRGRTFGFLQSMARIVLVLVLAIGPALAGLIGLHTFTFTDYSRITYNGAAFVFMLAAIVATTLGVYAYRQMDDRAGTSLRQDLLDAWVARRDRPEQMARRAYPGLFIAFEGGDGTGKSTQARLLADWLRGDQGHEVVLTREPGATPVGVRLREVLLGHGSDLGSRAEALMFAADRAHHVSSVVRPALERGAVVVTDRYMDSSIAYQGAGRELDIDEVARLSRWATDGLVPDLTVVLDLHPMVTKARRAKDAARSGEDRLESLPDDFHERVRARFLGLARREPHRYFVVDAGLGVDEIQQRVRRRAQDVLPISAKRRAELRERLVEEEQSRTRRANAEAEVLKMDAELRARRMAEARARDESRRRAREEVERQLQEEAERAHRAEQAARREHAARAERGEIDQDAVPTMVMPQTPAQGIPRLGDGASSRVARSRQRPPAPVPPTTPSTPTQPPGPPSATAPTAPTPTTAPAAPPTAPTAAPTASHAAERAAAAAVRSATGDPETNPRGTPVDVRDDDERPLTRRERRGRE